MLSGRGIPGPDGALHAGAVDGVQWAFLVSGIAGIVAGLIVLGLMRPARKPVIEPAPELAPA